MQDVSTFTEMRKHPRAQLQLPARIRWQGPLGMRLEVTRTLDVSRQGVLVQRFEPCEPLTRVWIIFPYDPDSDSIAQMEIPARIVRAERGECTSWRVALCLESPVRASPVPYRQERRRSQRVNFAVPIFVRPRDVPWPEECMTQDVSNDGARFETSHIYGVGDRVLATLPWSEWSNRGEMAGCVVRISSIGGPAAGVPDDPRGAAPNGSGITALWTSVAIEWMKDHARSGNGKPMIRKSYRTGGSR
jgi:hypothetical protein